MWSQCCLSLVQQRGAREGWKGKPEEDTRGFRYEEVKFSLIWWPNLKKILFSDGPVGTPFLEGGHVFRRGRRRLIYRADLCLVRSGGSQWCTPVTGALGKWMIVRALRRKCAPGGIHGLCGRSRRE